MLTLTQSTSAAGTAKYFETLSAGDYYLGERVVALWRGKTAGRLGLTEGSELTKEQFMALLAGRNPANGKPLTQRKVKNRRPGMDMTLSVPKSVSLAFAINKDEAVLTAFRDAVNTTMAEDVEPLMHRRVRDGQYSGTKQRTQTGNMLWAGFEHKTSRPVGDLVDPQLHAHCFVFNVTEQDGQFYAAELEEIVRRKARLEAGFYARLAKNLEQSGYRTVRTRNPKTGRLSFEIEGIERSTIEKFSTRTKQIEEHATKHGITDAAQKAQLGKKLREKKDTGTPLDSLHVHWDSRLTDAERDAFRTLRGDDGKKQAGLISPEKAVRFALDHHFENESTVEEHQLVATALRYAVKQSPQAIEAALNHPDIIRQEKDALGASRRFVTTHVVLEQERFMIEFARDGRGTKKTLCPGTHEFQRDYLNSQQRAVVQHIRDSRDQTIVVTGGAGTGKTATMSEAAEAIGSAGKQVFACAPSTSATEVLKESGFAEAKTVEHLIRNTKLHDRLRDQVMLVDEAGLLDARSMTSLFQIAEKQNARIILVGDPRQHASPKRGESLTIIEKEAGLKIARLDKIQRQKGDYREAVELISRGNEIIDQETKATGLLAGFDKLYEMGKVIELRDEERHVKLAESYIEASERGKSTIVVAPTHAEGRAVTETIRERLRENGTIATEEKPVLQLRSLHLTNAEKSERYSYDQDGLIVQFHQNAKGGFTRGQRYRVVKTEGTLPGLVPFDKPKTTPRIIPTSQAERFEVYREDAIGLSVGDTVRFTLGGSGIDKKSRIANGRIDEIKAFQVNGDLVLKSGIVVSRNYGHLNHGFVVTSHSSQGHTRDIAIAAMGSDSLPAVNARQAYVTISRGRHDVKLFVDDKAAVRRAIQRAGTQLSATELMAKATGQQLSHETKRTADRTLAMEHRRRTLRDRVRRWWQSFGPRVGQAIANSRPVSPSPAPPELRRC
ncbi:MobF family relaxase [Fuerstiella marisgermanici]|uniref:Multifunctional conjugation protein TraI n=1 Tax=Fuerstiella marisgermanici TaxID=1891926 RepID=A0A1P8WP75_9PLAN|nr:MobF family relaxase [Fuerstiella marisgermanici]APZ95859.1 Multifunctional conjugation protein TraI [Fuerstiella marisgermanici]